MKPILLATSLLAFGVGTALAPHAYAAHAGAPYSNVDHSNDAGNDTGDSRVDGLNAQQSNENYKGVIETRPPAQPAMIAPAQPTIVVPAQTGMVTPAPPPGMPPPPPGAVR